MESESFSPPSGSFISSWLQTSAYKANEATSFDHVPLNGTTFNEVPVVDPITYSIASQSGSNFSVVTHLVAGKLGSSGRPRHYLTSPLSAIANDITVILPYCV